MKIRQLTRSEIPYIWQIDRREVIDNVYYLRDGKLVLEPEHYEMRGWPSGEPEHYTPSLLDCFDRGGHFWGMFESDLLIGVVILEGKFIGSQKDTLQMKFLHVSNHFRKQGLGKKLFALAAEKAIELGAKKMYISATPSENTVNFYMRLGCKLTTEIDQEIFALEPDDIHLEFSLKGIGDSMNYQDSPPPRRKKLGELCGLGGSINQHLLPLYRLFPYNLPTTSEKTPSESLRIWV